MIGETQIEAMQLGGLRQVIDFETRRDVIPGLFDQMMGLYRGAGIIVAAPEIALYRMVSDDQIEVTIGVEMDDLLPGFAAFDAPATRALRLRHKGPFSTLHEVFPRLHAEAAQRGLRATGYAREVYRLIAKDPAHNICDVYLDVE